MITSKQPMIFSIVLHFLQTQNSCLCVLVFIFSLSLARPGIIHQASRKKMASHLHVELLVQDKEPLCLEVHSNGCFVVSFKRVLHKSEKEQHSDTVFLTSFLCVRMLTVSWILERPVKCLPADSEMIPHCTCTCLLLFPFRSCFNRGSSEWSCLRFPHFFLSFELQLSQMWNSTWYHYQAQKILSLLQNYSWCLSQMCGLLPYRLMRDVLPTAASPMTITFALPSRTTRKRILSMGKLQNAFSTLTGHFFSKMKLTIA